MSDHLGEGNHCYHAFRRVVSISASDEETKTVGHLTDSDQNTDANDASSTSDGGSIFNDTTDTSHSTNIGRN